jgi:hypothetical protein
LLHWTRIALTLEFERKTKIEDTKGHDNDQKKNKVKMTNNDLQSITQKIND